MKRIFIQSGVTFPRGGAQANYIGNLAKAIKASGYEVILISGINQEYIKVEKSSVYDGIVLEPIMHSIDKEKNQYQREHGFATERMHVLHDYNIKEEDVVITFEIGYNRYYHSALLELREKVGFKVIAAVVELYGKEDFVSIEKYEVFKYAIDELYPRYDAVLSISENVDNYFAEKDIKTYRLPPLTDVKSVKAVHKENKKYSFLLISYKDSFKNIIRALLSFSKEEIQKMEVHICGVGKENIRKYISIDEWGKLKEFVIVYDWLTYERLEELYGRMHYLVIAREECQRTLANFPSKVPECMSYGIVPIVSKVGDYTKFYLSNEVNSIFMDGDSEEVIKNALRRAIQLSNEEFARYSQNALLCAKEKFDYRVWIDTVKKMLTLG